METVQKQETISQAHLTTGRAIDQLRRQLGLLFKEENGNVVGAVPVEGLSPEMLASLKGKKYLLLTSARARAIGLITSPDTKLVRIDANHLSLPQIMALADPLAEEKKPTIQPLPATPSCAMLLSMAKYAALLPAMLVSDSAPFPPNWLSVSAADLKAYWDSPPLDMVPVASAKLPTLATENARLICFRQRYGTSTHLALIIGNLSDTPLTRIHSSCLTGDILGSLRCDCGDQLKLALEQISAAGSGIFLYLHQEGRGIGIANKLRAYALQERGIDTYDANLMLGFDEDERDFSIAAAILKKLGVSKIKMLTNNPHKMAEMEKNGIKVASRVPVIIPPGKHNANYLSAKAKKSGHLF